MYWPRSIHFTRTFQDCCRRSTWGPNQVVAVRSSTEPSSSLSLEVDARSPALSWSLESVTQQNATDSKHPAPKTSTKALGSNGISSQQQPRSLHVTSASRKLKRPADWPEAVAQQPRSAQVECGRNCSLGFGRIGCKQLVTPASKPRPRIESSSSGESVEQAVRYPPIEELLKHLPHLSI